MESKSRKSQLCSLIPLYTMLRSNLHCIFIPVEGQGGIVVKNSLSNQNAWVQNTMDSLCDLGSFPHLSVLQFLIKMDVIIVPLCYWKS